MTADFPRKLAFLIDPASPDYRKRNKILYGGRGGLKSWGAVDAVLIRGTQQFERALFCRETMDSIKESCHFLLEQRIYDLGLKQFYTIQQQAIVGPEWHRCGVCYKSFTFTPKSGICAACKGHLREYGKGEIIFNGLRHNVRNIKSLEGVTIVIVEEAESVSKESWETLLPTIRWEDKRAGRASEVWVIFNPRLKKDDTYKRWILETPADTVLSKTSWRDNPWFPDVLRSQMEHMKKVDYQGYLHVWEGECVQALAGAIFATEYAKADTDGRICSVPYDPAHPVSTYWDLGFGDRNCIWFAQHINGWTNCIDYLESNGQTLAWYVQQMQAKGYVWGTDYLPHDGVDAMLHGKLTGDRSKSPDQVLRGLGRNVRVAPKLEITTRINAARTIFPLCRFDTLKCREGLDGLQQYQWGPDAASGQERTKPLHNWASHPADGFCTLAVSARPMTAPVEAPRHQQEEYSWMG